MSSNLIVLDYLLAGLCESVLKDEENDGIDISAGLLGEYTSDWIRSVANGIEQNQELIAKQAEQIKMLRSALTVTIAAVPASRYSTITNGVNALDATKDSA